MRTHTSRVALSLLLSGLLLTGCATSGGQRVDNKGAAAANAELGAHYLQLGQLQIAKDKLESAEKQDPENFKVHWTMALLFERLDKPADAERHYRAAMRLAPENPEVANLYASFLCKTGKVDEALPVFETVVRNRLYRTPWAAATNAAVCLRSDKRNADAVPWLERALNLRSDYIDAVIQMADAQLALDKAALSRQAVDRYLELPRRPADKPLLADVMLLGVRAALKQGDRQAADNFARLLRRDFPSAPQTQSLPQLLQGAK